MLVLGPRDVIPDVLGSVNFGFILRRCLCSARSPSLSLSFYLVSPLATAFTERRWNRQVLIPVTCQQQFGSKAQLPSHSPTPHPPPPLGTASKVPNLLLLEKQPQKQLTLRTQPKRMLFWILRSFSSWPRVRIVLWFTIYLEIHEVQKWVWICFQSEWNGCGQRTHSRLLHGLHIIPLISSNVRTGLANTKGMHVGWNILNSTTGLGTFGSRPGQK